MTLSPIAHGILASLAAGAATGLGALPVLFLVTRIRPAVNAALLGFGAGVMLAATSFSLIVPAIAASEAQGAGALASSLVVAVGMLLGAAILLALHELLPHEHFVKGREGISSARVRGIWLFVFAITLHNLPEGLAVGVGFGGDDRSKGTSLAIGIGLQNLPEGLAVALALLQIGTTRVRAFLIALLTGLVEPLGGLVGVTAVTASQSLLPWGLAFAAGSMLFVISNEIIPESHREGKGLAGTIGVVVGFVVMMLLDTALG